jgi:pyruvate kinase
VSDPKTKRRDAVPRPSRHHHSAQKIAAPRLPALAESKVVLRTIAEELARIESHLRNVEARLGPLLRAAQSDWIESARNLVHYTALRQLDLRELQLLLQERGLSSLGRSESFVMASLLEVRLRVAEALLARGKADRSEIARIAQRRAGALSWQTAEFLLHTHTHEMLGPKPDGRHVYVMVTAPDAAEADQAWLTRMLRAGMNVLRINCAHQGPEQWSRVIDALGAARRETGLECRVLMDLAGPKIRTGRVAESVRVATWKLRRDEIGRTAEPTLVAIRPISQAGQPAARPILLLADDWFAELRERDVLRFRDTRGKKRDLVVRTVAHAEAVAAIAKRAYVVEETRFAHVRRGRALRRGNARIGGASKAAIPLAVGDILVVTGREIEGHAVRRDARARIVAPATVACTVPEALARVEVGHRVLFDDGKIAGVVERIDGSDLHVRIRHTAAPVAKLRAEKGINLPDSVLPIAALTADDRVHLAFVARHADLVGLSFVRSPADVRALHAALESLQRRDVGIVLKIETKAGFANLPPILLEAMRRPPVAMMIARGDLAVELGFERLAEVQEEILWLCEASHVPAIWATQVLDTLARTGVPSRAEVTDAAASVAAECVMLNKGPHVEEALRVLVDILRRMERHHYKKRSIFRKLRVSALGEVEPAIAP